mgnify:FL=1
MTLGERIAYYRKKAGYSQEGLAEQLNVSRQAISKWETGEATPDAERIIALAAVLGISTDTLLLGKEEPERPYTEAETVRQPAPMPEWLDHLPRHIGRLFREKGYIAGYIVAAQGLGVLLVGLLARFGFGSILSMQKSAWSSVGSWGSIDGMGSMSAAFRFPLIFADIICVLGGIVIIGGVALAIIWKRRVQK